MIEIESSDVYSYSDDDSNLSISKYESEMSYNKFFRNHLEKNMPCIFDSWLTQDWPAAKDWVNPNGTPNCKYLSDTFGEAEVPVANCDRRHFDSHTKETLVLTDYLKYYQKEDRQQSECLYLKDWHWAKAFPSGGAYATPAFFGSDWLNEFWAQRTDAQDDYKFVYIGPKGSWTPLHCDVFRSFSWSSNVCGRKRWLFFSPGDTTLLKDRFGDLAYDVEDARLRDVREFPLGSLAEGKGLEVIQERGQTVFVPSGWSHQVWNLEDTISINHNWVNATNAEKVVDFFLASLREVEAAISDCRSMDGWSSQVQKVLKATHGMDAREMTAFLLCIARRRLQALRGGDVACEASGSPWVPGRRHLEYDACKVALCLDRLMEGLPSEALEECLAEGQRGQAAALPDQLRALL